MKQKKYSWFQNHNEKFPFTVKFNNNGDDETLIALTDTAEKADFISKACNLLSELLPSSVLDQTDWHSKLCSLLKRDGNGK